MPNVYKFLSEQVVDKLIINNTHLSLKLSSLEDYNDPFEFFLTIDFKQEPNLIAYYLEMLDMYKKNLVTCFSKYPNVTPLWAHYASDSKGFCLELDEEIVNKELASNNVNYLIEDICYSDKVDDNLEEVLKRAFYICKPRYTYFLQFSLIRAAYFRKQTIWSYEHERRLIMESDSSIILNVNGISILPVPTKALKSIIVGHKATVELKERLKKLSDSFGCRFLEARFAKSTLNTFFVDDNNKTLVFEDGSIVNSNSFCEVCNEPYVSEKLKTCSLCGISSKNKAHASSINPYRIFAGAGILDGYISGMDRITERITDSKK